MTPNAPMPPIGAIGEIGGWAVVTATKCCPTRPKGLTCSGAGYGLSAMQKRILTALFLLFVFAVPAQAKEPGLSNPDESTPTTLYFHIMDSLNDIPINTQVPSAEFERSERPGSATNSLCFTELSDPDPPLG